MKASDILNLPNAIYVTYEIWGSLYDKLYEALQAFVKEHENDEGKFKLRAIEGRDEYNDNTKAKDFGKYLVYYSFVCVFEGDGIMTDVDENLIPKKPLPHARMCGWGWFNDYWNDKNLPENLLLCRPACDAAQSGPLAPRDPERIAGLAFEDFETADKRYHLYQPVFSSEEFSASFFSQNSVPYSTFIKVEGLKSPDKPYVVYELGAINGSKGRLTCAIAHCSWMPKSILDSNHAFDVLSFAEKRRMLEVGLCAYASFQEEIDRYF